MFQRLTGCSLLLLLLLASIAAKLAIKSLVSSVGLTQATGKRILAFSSLLWFAQYFKVWTCYRYSRHVEAHRSGRANGSTAAASPVMLTLAELAPGCSYPNRAAPPARVLLAHQPPSLLVFYQAHCRMGKCLTRRGPGEGRSNSRLDTRRLFVVGKKE